MARRALGDAAHAVVQAIGEAVAGPEFDAGAVVGCSGGADSTALALGARVALGRRGVPVLAVVVDHGLFDGSADIAERVAARLVGRGVPASAVRVEVRSTGAGREADARDARLAALVERGSPVLLGHTMDDQAEQVLLGLARGSGARSLSGMAPVRGLFHRPLLGLRRETTLRACSQWGVETWDDPANRDHSLARVRARRRALPCLEAELGPGVVEALARTADLLRADADLLDAAAEAFDPGGDELEAAAIAELPDALRTRVLRSWLRRRGLGATKAAVDSVDRLVTDWRGQRWVDVSGGRVARASGRLVAESDAG